MKEQMSGGAYKDAGVDIIAAADLVEKIKPAIKKHDAGRRDGRRWRFWRAL